jgi:hypothetical protein
VARSQPSAPNRRQPIRGSSCSTMVHEEPFATPRDGPAGARTLGTTAVLSVALGACSTIYGARDGTIEYRLRRWTERRRHLCRQEGHRRKRVPALWRAVTTIVERNRLQRPIRAASRPVIRLPVRRAGQYRRSPTATAAAPGPVTRNLAPRAGAAPRSAAAPAASGAATPLGRGPPAAAGSKRACRPPRRVWPAIRADPGATPPGAEECGIIRPRPARR